MLDVLYDGPFRYLHCKMTGELIIVLHKHGSTFVEFEGEGEPVYRTLTEWKAIARRRMGDRINHTND